MSAANLRAREIFVHAVGKVPPESWDAYVADACAGDPALHGRVCQLLRAHAEAGSFQEDAAPVAGALPDELPLRERPGSVIGPYKLLEQIGEGGFGVVFMAEQQHPVRRKVALKVIKPGMDTRQVIARFEAERQALALMDHPNIAHVLDAGETDSGLPFFVMELVRGIPITDFCDEHQLTPAERLELFMLVCQAVQHAHQKGIIHRDLKPANVMVTLYDGTPVPKVIDFGIAKATGWRLTEKTLFTNFAQMVGTPLFMSPEQAALSGLDVDTRSDVYSLGVLLYELLTGTTPFDKERLRSSAYDEVRRIIREEEPPKPSKRLSTLGATLTSVSAHRKTDPKRLGQLVRGELDWIVMKALEKDRRRRYETASALAHDVQCCLRDEPVSACPPSAWYRFQKFARRNRGAVLAVTVIFLLLVGGIAGTTWGMVRAQHAQEEETRQRQRAEAAAAVERAAKEAEAEQRTRAEEARKKATREAAVAAAINNFLNRDLLQLTSPTGQVGSGVSPDANLRLRTVLQRAAKRIDGKFPNEPEVEMRIRYTIGHALMSVGDSAGALPQFEKVAAYSQQLLGRDDPYTLNAEYRVAAMHRALRRDDALPLLEENVERQKTILGQGHIQTLRAMGGLAYAYHAAGQTEKALQLGEQTLELRKRHLGPNHLDTLTSMNNLALSYRQKLQIDKAVSLFEEALAGFRAKFPPLHPERMNTTRNLAHTYYTAEQIDRALPLQEMVMGQYKTAYGFEDQATQSCIDSLIAYYVYVGSCDKAEALLKSIQMSDDNRSASPKQQQQQREKRHRELIDRVRPAAEKYQKELAAKKADHPDTLAARQAFAVALRIQKRNPAAAYHLKAVLDARQRLSPAEDPDTQVCRLELATIRLQQKKYAEAEALLLEAHASWRQHEERFFEAKRDLDDVVRRLVQLYDAWGKKDKAEEWRQKVDEPKKP